MAQKVKHPALGDIQLVGQPFTLSQHPHALRSATLERGEDTDDILTNLGLDAAEIADLRKRHVI
jgi:crotonobetainyl-CoA:carnitine CoA-transferase CaiB-like acyl-CoA transferase